MKILKFSIIASLILGGSRIKPKSLCKLGKHSSSFLQMLLYPVFLVSFPSTYICLSGHALPPSAWQRGLKDSLSIPASSPQRLSHRIYLMGDKLLPGTAAKASGPVRLKGSPFSMGQSRWDSPCTPDTLFANVRCFSPLWFSSIALRPLARYKHQGNRVW